MTMRADGQRPGNGVVRALHEERGTQTVLALPTKLQEEFLAVLQHAVGSTQDDGIGGIHPCLPQGCERGHQGRLQQLAETAGLQRSHEFAQIVQGSFRRGTYTGHSGHLESDSLNRCFLFRLRCPFLRFGLGKYQRGVIAAEAEAVAHHVTKHHALFARTGHNAARHGMVPSQVGRNEPILQGQQAYHGLNAAGCRGGMTGKRFGTRHRWNMIAKYPQQGSTLTGIVVGCACAVGVHIADGLRCQSGHVQGFLHGQGCPFAVIRRGSLMKSITTIAVAGQDGQRLRSPTLHGGRAFQHHEAGSLAEVQATAGLIERTAPLRVENHQRVEAVEMKQAQRLTAAGYHGLCLARLDHIGSHYQRIGCRRAGGGDGHSTPGGYAEVVGHQSGSGAGIVRRQQRQPLIALQHLEEMAFRAVHAAHCRAGQQPSLVQRQAGLLQGLSNGLNAQQGGAVAALIGRDMKPLTQFLIGKIHLAAGQILMDRRQHAQRLHTGTSLQQGPLGLCPAVANGRDNAHTGNINRFVHRCQVFRPIHFVRCSAT